MSSGLRKLIVRQVAIPGKYFKVYASSKVIEKVQADLGGYIYTADKIYVQDLGEQLYIDVGPGSVYTIDEHTVIISGRMNKKIEDDRLKHRGHY